MANGGRASIRPGDGRGDNEPDREEAGDIKDQYQGKMVNTLSKVDCMEDLRSQTALPTMDTSVIRSMTRGVSSLKDKRGL